MRELHLSAVLSLLLVSSALATAPPRHGGPMPEGYYHVLERNRDAFRLSHGWINHIVPERGESNYRVGGSTIFAVPVLCAVFSGQSAPYASSVLQTKLFDGPSATGTIGDYYSEVSYGAFSADGVVADWFTLTAVDTFYEGTSNGLLEGDARVGVLIKELLDANDAAMDFGDFDNDGPDGVPNSGDDDGFVDLLVVVHNEFGGECGGNDNIWSHSRDYRAWPVSGGQPYETNDAAAGGGFIRVTDYAIQPALDCAADTVDIGGFCHEIGHALGIPDLFDDSGATSGIGDWGLMGSGQYNTTESPAHPCAWTRAKLGWVTPIDVDAEGAMVSVNDIETTGDCLRLGFTGGHFNRMTECVIGGTYSMRCGIDAAEAATRGWEGGAGYGNNWDETIERAFTFDGTTPVTLSYDYSYDLEFDYDSIFVSVCVDTIQTVLTTYSGVGAGTDSLDLTAILMPLGADTTYTIKFRVVSDPFNSDEDGDYLSTCGALVLDNIFVTGGGENYNADFESHGGGWYQDPSKNAPTEYWLIENRQPSGFDSNLHNSGLIIYHVDDAVLTSKLGNSGGNAGATVRGIVIEEADGQFDLLQDPETTGNRGDAGDPYPGSSNNTAFDANTTPGAVDNSGNATIIELSGIGASGSPMTVFARGGDPGPSAALVDPDTLQNDISPAHVTLTGAGLTPGIVMRLVRTGEPDIVANSVVWQDGGTVECDLPIYGRAGGDWDLIVTNTDGRSDTLAFLLRGVETGERITLYRSVAAVFSNVADNLAADSDDWYRYTDRDVTPGTTYRYKLVSRTSEGAMREIYDGTVTTPSRELSLGQNYPNPFNPTTEISFFLPKPTEVRLEIYDVTGARVRTLAVGHTPAGPHTRVWDGRDTAGNAVGSGVYFYRLTADDRQITRKMVLLK